MSATSLPVRRRRADAGFRIGSGSASIVAAVLILLPSATAMAGLATGEMVAPSAPVVRPLA